jgi:hypothetical protein
LGVLLRVHASCWCRSWWSKPGYLSGDMLRRRSSGGACPYIFRFSGVLDLPKVSWVPKEREKGSFIFGIQFVRLVSTRFRGPLVAVEHSGVKSCLHFLRFRPQKSTIFRARCSSHKSVHFSIARGFDLRLVLYVAFGFGSRGRELYPRRTCPLEDGTPNFDTVYRDFLYVETRPKSK